jgi:hypothetical protein
MANVKQPHPRTREMKLRRMAARQGLALVKSRRRDPRALDFGTYWLVDANDPKPARSHAPWIGHPDGFGSLDEVEAFLNRPVNTPITRFPQRSAVTGGAGLVRTRGRALLLTDAEGRVIEPEPDERPER